MDRFVRVLKFGGSSISSRQGLARMRKIVATALDDKRRLVVVVSSFEKTKAKLQNAAESALRGDGKHDAILEDLIAQYRQLDETNLEEDQATLDEQIKPIFDEIRDIIRGISLLRDISAHTKDLLLSKAEIVASVVAAAYLRRFLPNVELHDARKLVQTNNNFGGATIELDASFELIHAALPGTSDISVLAGGIGATETGDTTTLGESGADQTAAALGAALGVEEIQLWTNVDGIMTADPRKVHKALTVPYLSFEEAMELCHFGAKVVYPRAMQPALDAGIPIRIKNALRPEHPGSLIGVQPPEHPNIISSISSISSIALLRLQGSGMLGVAGIARRLFDALSHKRISIILISQASSEHSICFAIPPQAIKAAKDALEHEFALEMKAHQIEPITVETDLSVIAVVGANMRNTPGISGRLFQALGKNGINIIAIAQGSSELNISVVIRSSDEAKALNAVHDAFFLSEVKTINLFVVGVGQVGGKLLEQIRTQANYFGGLKLELRVVALADSRRLAVNPAGLNLDSWRSLLEESPKQASLDLLVERIKELNLPNSIFVDCSASAEVAERYRDILAASVSIVTPNKRANSGPLDFYRSLKQQATKANVKFFYETTVGAGLPIIGTLNDLILSGDEIIRIEAVLSGTLSYIFNGYSSERFFSDVVREAMEKGLTEPDPRDDLSGMDVGRKLLILAREMGLSLEPEDIEVESLVPENCRAAPDLNTFFAELTKADHIFAGRLKQAQNNNQTLRYIGIIGDGCARVSLQSVDSTHPFAGLSGSDNIISFVTKRYFDRPLVIKGPGAGTEVTAAGVLADIVRAAGYIS